MGPKVVHPALGAKSFSCPHCGALANQTWYQVYVDAYRNDEAPSLPPTDIISIVENDHGLGDEGKANWVRYFKKVLAKDVFTHRLGEPKYLILSVPTLSLSACFSCGDMALWQADKLLYPSHRSDIIPNDDMPTDVRKDFLEAASIVDQSPRGAAALLRLAVQKLMTHVGEKGKDIDKDIGSLVRKGLDVRVQRALDIVRVIGNHAVHPGRIDLRDDKATALRLFDLVNVIVEDRIGTPKRIDAMYGDLPEGALNAIEMRDGGN
jgi:hypothetical protein